MKKKARILIIRFSSIGDILLTTPFIRQVRTKFPQARIDYVIKEQFWDLIRFNPHINNIYKLKSESGIEGLKQLTEELQKNDYDYVFDLHGSLRSNFICKRLKNPTITKINKNKLNRALLVYIKWNRYKAVVPIPQRYLDVGKFAGISDDFYGLEIFWKDGVEKKKTDILINNKIYKKPYIVLVPGAGYFTKQWPVEYFKEFIKSFTEKRDEKIVLLGNKNEKALNETLLISKQVRNLSGKLSLLEAATIINDSKALLSNDSGMMHMAGAVNTPLVSVFGSTSRELGFFPYRSKSQVVENNELWCRPCSHIGRKKCPLSHFKCMRSLKPELVFEKFVNMMEDK